MDSQNQLSIIITKIKQKIPKIEQNANMIYFDIVYLEENT